MTGTVVAVSRRSDHDVSKLPQDSISLIAGHGVEGDAHAGASVKHRSRVRADPAQPNLRQVHLIHAELHDELGRFDLRPGEMGENVTTRGIDLLRLPRRARLRLGEEAVVEITGLRNPCRQLDGLRPGLMAAVIERTPAGGLIRKAGVMGIVVGGGVVRPGDQIQVVLPDEPHEPLGPV